MAFLFIYFCYQLNISPFGPGCYVVLRMVCKDDSSAPSW